MMTEVVSYCVGRTQCSCSQTLKMETKNKIKKKKNHYVLLGVKLEASRSH